MSDLISREAVCKIVADRVTDKFEKKAACHGIRALPAAQVKVEDVLNAAHNYLVQQYGSSPLKHPLDRARILALIDKGK